MPSPSLNPSPEIWAPRDLLALRRFVERNLDLGFRLALVEAESHAEREQILAPLLTLTGPRVLQVDCAQLEGHNLWHELLTLFQETQPRMVVLSGVVSGTPQDWMRQLNVQRDLFTRDLKVPWILFLHPAQRVPLMTIAPDFSDYVVLWVRRQETPPEAGLPEPISLPMPMMLPSAPLPGDVHPLLQQAGLAIEAEQLDQAQDLLSRFDLRPDMSEDQRFLRRILGARLARAKGQLQTAEHLLRVCRDELTESGPPGTASTNRYALELSLGQVLIGQGRFPEAAEAFQRSADLAQQVFGADSPLCCIPWTQLAQALWLQGKFVQAEALIERCMSLYAQAPHQAPPILRTSLLQSAMLFIARGQYAEAEKLLRGFIETEALLTGPQHPGSADLLSALAISLRNQGKYAEAEELLRSSLVQSEARYGAHHPRYGAYASALAGILQEQGKLTEAEELLRRSLAIQEKQFGPHHLNYVLTLHLLARVLHDQNKQVEAEALLVRCLANTERALGAAHPSYATMASDLAMVRLALGRGLEAQELAERALAITQQAHGPLHPDVGHRLHSLAFIQRKLGQPQAQNTAQRAVDVLTQSLGAEHPATRRAVALLESLSGPQAAPLKAAG